ncbi:MAG: DUF4386 domain-containing protein [Candidatus Margulisiibacteriota bacterium]
MEKLSQQRVSTALRILYPLWLVFGSFSVVYVPSKLLVLGNAGETANNILSNELLFRASISGSLITQLIFIFAVLLLYRLFESVNKSQALLMVVLALVSVPIAMLNELNSVAALMLLNSPEQMMLFLNLHAQGIIIASIFWGLWLFPLGYLAYKSGYFPKVIGGFVIIAGIGYTLGSFIKLLMPGLESAISIFELMAFGEVIFLAWLVIRGAKLDR